MAGMQSSAITFAKMSFLSQRSKKPEYQILPSSKIQNEKTSTDEIIACEGFSVESVNYFINNFIYPTDSQGQSSDHKKFNQKEVAENNSSSLIYNSKRASRNDRFHSEGDHKKIFDNIDHRKLATFMKLKKKLENMKNFYPNIYYSKESIIELWAKQDQLNEVNLEILNYDKESPQWIWF